MSEEIEIIKAEIVEEQTTAIGPVIHHDRPKDYSGARSDEHLIEMFISSRKSPRTRELYTRSIRIFREQIPGPLRDMTLDQFQVFVQSIKDEGLKPATVLARVAPIKSLFSYGMKLGYLPYNVPAVVELEKPAAIIEEKVLPERDCQKIFAALEKNNPDHWLLCYSIYATGARVSEFISLQVKHFIREGEAAYVIFRGESTKSSKTRRIGMPSWLADNIERHIEEREKKPDDHIFTYRRQGIEHKYTRQGVYSMLNRTCTRNNLPHCTPHMLRHSIATHAIQRGTPIQEVSYKLGHSGVDITARTYDHSDKTEGFKSGLL